MPKAVGRREAPPDPHQCLVLPVPTPPVLRCEGARRRRRSQKRVSAATSRWSSAGMSRWAGWGRSFAMDTGPGSGWVWESLLY